MKIREEKNDFQRMVNRERARADRMGHHFSVIFFDVLKSQKSTCDMETIETLIRKRIRVYDDICSVDGSRIAVLLPYTDDAQANSVAKNIISIIAPEKAALQYSIMSYPDNWVKNGEEMSGSSIDAWADASQQLVEKLNMQVLPLPAWKRSMDIMGAVFGLLLLSPVMLLLAIYIKIVSPGPVLFKQERIGFLGKKFGCYKFRTMHLNASSAVHNSHLNNLINSDGPMYKLDKVDSRIIPFGRIIRMTGLDELSQLFNVLRGDMSLIGPRPCIPYEADEFKLWQRKRFDVVPGITGLWQVNGKNRTSFTDMMRYDISYTYKRNFYLDTAILLKTIPAIIEQVTDNKKTRQEETVNGKCEEKYA
jgi:lipopolysaccharide/colanic/teichoic acid biosynthesis glycosyltransferase